MATFYTLEQIKTRVFGIGSKASKINWLKAECGMSDSQANEIWRNLWSRDDAPERPSRPREARALRFTIGVEIEAINIDRDRIRRSIEADGIPTRDDYYSYNHNDSRDTYKFMSDSSLNGHNPCEIVSPILRTTTTLKTVCKHINAAGGTANSSCGLHVHVGAESMSPAAIRRIVINYGRIEAAIDSFMPASRRGNCRWAASMATPATRLLTMSNPTMSDIQYACNHDRYYKVNVMAYNRHKTIEFRQHSGTTNYAKIENWIKFVTALCDYSIRHEELLPVITNINDLPFLNATQKAYYSARRDALR